MTAMSPLWFTLCEGVVSEVYYPRIDCANTRCLELFVVDGNGAAGERWDTDHTVQAFAPGIPGYVLTNTCRQKRFRLTKTIFADIRRAALLIRVKFEPAKAAARSPLRLFAMLQPHLVNQGSDNRAWTGDFRGVPLLLAARAHVTLALGCSAGWGVRHCALVHDAGPIEAFGREGRVPDESAGPVSGNVALLGEIPGMEDGGEFLLVLGFGEHADAAGHCVRAALLSDFEDTEQEFRQSWIDFHRRGTASPAPHADGWDVYRTSLAVLRTHESKRFHGGIIASLATPWGDYHGDSFRGGYHVAWPRDLAHAGVAYLAAGRPDAAQQALFYLMCTQNPAGDWTQNMWIDGTPNWTAKQLDQTASFILLADLLRRHDEVGMVDPWPAVRGAAEYIVHNGPQSEQDRWEENAGYTPYTLATAIAALAAAAEFARAHGDERGEAWLRTADTWNDSIERWLYVTETPLAEEVGVPGYYVRIAPPETTDASQLHHLIVPLKNYQPEAKGRFEAWRITSPDVFALVRYGLRRADDSRIRNTLRVIDATLRDETRAGPAWRRFNHDGYGETADGGPFVGAGVGRCWPILTGERAHYELAAGNCRGAAALLDTMARQASHGLLPEQIWNAGDIPDRGLFNGRPTGSATPLVWAHAEFITLARSLRDGDVFDCPPQVQQRFAPAERDRLRPAAPAGDTRAPVE
jgi:glucoamylase